MWGWQFHHHGGFAENFLSPVVFPHLGGKSEPQGVRANPTKSEPMPLVSHFPLPTFAELKARGHQVLDLNQARCQDIRELHIGFLNMMPDAAFQVTERQYFRLIGACNQIVQFFVHPFTVPGIERGEETQQYINSYYNDFTDLKRAGLDALIITGANVSKPDLTTEAFWQPLREVVDWAQKTVTSVMCSCLASHAIVEMLYGVKRRRLDRKRWGVYQHVHRNRDMTHPLLRDVNTRFDIPHSRWNTLELETLEQAGLNVLVVSQEEDVHLATSPDGFRFIFSQGHPEYDINSLLKEYKREVFRFTLDERPTYPPFPENYFNERCQRLGRSIERRARRLKAEGKNLRQADFLESDFKGCLHNTWGDSGKAVFNNWLGLVYQLTHVDRRRLFLEGVDPKNPLGL
jgi:homoserine O-succinyltransferase/O-acetyltransferase